MIEQQGPEDQDFGRHMLEVKRLFEEPVQIKRWIAGPSAVDDELLLGGDGAGSGPETFFFKPTFANITVIEQREQVQGNTFYEIGDLMAEFRIPIFGAETERGDGNSTGVFPIVPRQADQVVYRGRTYRIMGHVERPFIGQTQYYKAHLRQLEK